MEIKKTDKGRTYHVPSEGELFAEMQSARAEAWASMRTDLQVRHDILLNLPTQDMLALNKGAAITRRAVFNQLMDTYRNYCTLQVMLENLDVDIEITGTILSSRLAQQKKAEAAATTAAQKELAKLLASGKITLEEIKSLLKGGDPSGI